MFDYTIFLLFLVIRKVISLFPIKLRIKSVYFIARIVFLFAPKFKKIGINNISKAFPNFSSIEKNELFKKSVYSFSRMIVDALRISDLDKNWYGENILCDDIEVINRARENAKVNNSGIMFLSGHLSSFELLNGFAGFINTPINFVARELKNQYLDKWILDSRSKFGNNLIQRKGASQKIVSCLNNKENVALLFDQNVRAAHAIFVPWFGEEAATTVVVGLSAYRTNCEILVVGLKFDEEMKKYRLTVVECNYQDCKDLEKDEFIYAVTKKASDIFCKMVLEYPEGWFWMHNRWRTQKNF